MRVIVTGSRHLYPREDAEDILAHLVMERFPKEIRIIHGCCPSNGLRNVDFAFDEAALNLGLEVEMFHPEQYGPWPGCGPKRNTAMVQAGGDLCIAYHHDLADSKGTLDCVRKCLQARIPVDWHDNRGHTIRLENVGQLDAMIRHAGRDRSHDAGSIPPGWLINQIGPPDS